MKNLLMSAALVGLTGTGAFAQCNVDQNQPSNAVYMAAFSQTDLAQSFQHQAMGNICGAGIFLQPNIGSTDNVTIELWDALPNQGGNLLATGSAQGTQGQWVDVFWSTVSISTNTTYYLVFTGNATLGISGDTGNPYPFGQVYANPGYNSFPNFDYTFRTYSDASGGGPALRLSGSCPGQVTVSWANATPNRPMGIVYANSTGNFTLPGGPCGGTTLGLSNSGLQLVQTINTGGGSGQVTGNAGQNACNGFLQLVVLDGTPCATSNVVAVP